MTTPLLASVPFLSGGSAACSTRGGVGERIGTEWVFDKSFLDFSLYTYILYLYFIALDFPTTVQRGQGTSISLALCRFYRAEAGIIVQTSKVVNR